MTKKITGALAVLVLAVFTLTGCGQAQAGASQVYVVHVPVDENGRTVTCVVPGTGGIDCDWSE